MSIVPDRNDRHAGSTIAFLRKAKACEESGKYWQETLAFLKVQNSYFKDLTRRNGEMRSTLPPNPKAVEKFIKEFNDFISVLDCLNDCIAAKKLIDKQHWEILSIGIQEAKEYWTSKIEGRLSEYLEKKQQGRSAREQFRFEGIDAIHDFSKSLDGTCVKLDDLFQ